MILSPGGEGSLCRSVLEKKSLLDVNKMLDSAALQMMKFKNMVQTYNQESTTDIRHYKFNPNCMLIRINEKILVNPYVAHNHAYKTYCFQFNKKQHPYMYQYYYDFFDRIFNSKKLSHYLKLPNT